MYAVRDIKLEPGAVHNIEVQADWGGRADWIVEKLLIGDEEGEVVGAPTTWVHVDSPYIPIASPGRRPKYIRAGQEVGHLIDPSLALDQPKTEDDWVQMSLSVDVLRILLKESAGVANKSTSRASNCPVYWRRLSHIWWIPIWKF